MMADRPLQERISRLIDLSRVAIHYGYLPLILYLGYTRSEPKPALIRYAYSPAQAEGRRRRLIAGHWIVSSRRWLKRPIDVEKNGETLEGGVAGIFLFLLLLYDYHGICGNEMMGYRQTS
jgi:import receptor subunit TOM7